VCIYLDGLSGHLHGNPATAAKDAEIRGWLRNHGYEVIEIAVSDLDDPGAMTRHFRRLAGYLNEPALRERVRDDPAWFAKAATLATQSLRAALRVVVPRSDERFRTCVPLVPLVAAAGSFGDPQHPLLDDWEWVEVGRQRELREGMFVAQVVGASMEPRIPDGSYCLFASPVTGARRERIVLVELLDEVDVETGERYTVKRYESEKVAEGEDGWRHVRVTLVPLNPAFAPIVLTADDEEAVRVVAEFVAVVGEEVARVDL
jgi:hypothetical protein